MFSNEIYRYDRFIVKFPDCVLLLFISLQRNQAGSSPAMEFVGFKQCMEYLIGYGLLITIFISDCHVSIASHMKKVLKNIAITSTSDI